MNNCNFGIFGWGKDDGVGGGFLMFFFSSFYVTTDVYLNRSNTDGVFDVLLLDLTRKTCVGIEISHSKSKSCKPLLDLFYDSYTLFSR